MRIQLVCTYLALILTACTTTSPSFQTVYHARDVDLSKLSVAGASISDLVGKPVILTGALRLPVGPTPVIEIPVSDANGDTSCLVLLMEPAKKRKLRSKRGKQVRLSGHFELIPASNELFLAFAYRSIKFDLACSHSMQNDQPYFYVDQILGA